MSALFQQCTNLFEIFIILLFLVSLIFEYNVVEPAFVLTPSIQSPESNRIAATHPFQTPFHF